MQCIKSSCESLVYNFFQYIISLALLKMSTEDCGKENYKLMSDSNVEIRDREICRDYDKTDEGGGLCKSILRSKSARLLAMLFFIVGYFFTELIVGKHEVSKVLFMVDLRYLQLYITIVSAYRWLLQWSYLKKLKHEIMLCSVWKLSCPYNLVN